MKYRKLGNTGLILSQVGSGALAASVVTSAFGDDELID